jgi:hypothetical protein
MESARVVYGPKGPTFVVRSHEKWMKHAHLTRRKLLQAGVTGAAATSLALASSCADSANDGSSSELDSGKHQSGDAGNFSLTLDHQLLDADDIRTRAIGNTLVGTVHDGETYELFLMADGAAILRMGEGRSETGRWELRTNGEIVSQWPTIANGEELVSRYYFNPSTGEHLNLATNGLRWSRFRIEAGNSRELNTTNA